MVTKCLQTYLCIKTVWALKIFKKILEPDNMYFTSSGTQWLFLALCSWVILSSNQDQTAVGPCKQNAISTAIINVINKQGQGGSSIGWNTCLAHRRPGSKPQHHTVIPATNSYAVPMVWYKTQIKTKSPVRQDRENTELDPHMLLRQVNDSNYENKFSSQA